MLQQLLTALALLLVFEGLMPALAPRRWQMLIRRLAATDSAQLRMMGLLMMCAGAILLLLL